jgi:hypothetical protein
MPLIMKLLFALAMALLSSAASPPSISMGENLLITRDDSYCGIDCENALPLVLPPSDSPSVFKTEVFCTDTTVCCNGTLQSVCMPLNHTCCDTGFFRAPGMECPPVNAAAQHTPTTSWDMCSIVSTPTIIPETDDGEEASDQGDEEESSAEVVHMGRTAVMVVLALWFL